MNYLKIELLTKYFHNFIDNRFLKNNLNTMAEEKIGDFMIRIGAMTPEQVNKVLILQKQNPDKLFGVIAIEKGFINDKALHEYINKDQS